MTLNPLALGINPTDYRAPSDPTEVGSGSSLRVYVYPADMFGCGYYRLIWPSQVLAEYGCQVTVLPPNKITGLAAERDPYTGVFKKAIAPVDADVIVMQRPSHPHLIEIIKLLRKQGVTVVVDVDDDLRHIHPSNPAWAHMHPRSSTEHSFQQVSRACREASFVTVSTSLLTKVYGGHGRVAVLQNYVPARFLDVEHDLDAKWIGWAGSTHSHPDDLRAMGNSISRLIAQHNLFKVVGDATGAGRQMGLAVDPNATGSLAFEEWPEAVTKIGVGVAPLADTHFNNAKSWLKPLEYAALGVPWVGSPRVEYMRLHALGCGIIAERSREWERSLRSLVNDKVLREELSAKGRAVASTLTIEEHAWRWMEAWLRAKEYDRSG